MVFPRDGSRMKKLLKLAVIGAIVYGIYRAVSVETDATAE